MPVSREGGSRMLKACQSCPLSDSKEQGKEAPQTRTALARKTRRTDPDVGHDSSR